MKTVAIIQARMGSTRLPGKVMKDIIGKPVLCHVIERVERAAGVDEIVVATTLNNEDQEICDLASKMNVSYFCGSEHDLITRVYDAAVFFRADLIVDITADCPLVDPGIIDNLIATFRNNEGHVGYVSNVLPDTWPVGFGVQVYDIGTLSFLNDRVRGDLREHTGWNVRMFGSEIKSINVSAPSRYRFPYFRMTLDTHEDYKAITAVFEHFNHNHFRAEEAVEFLSRTPSVVKINQHIEQKNPEDKLRAKNPEDKL